MPDARIELLIVEDDDDTRRVLADVLRDQGYLVETATHGREAIDALQRGSRPEVIVLDLMMPVMNGWEFHAWLRESPRLRGTAVVVVSGTGDPGPPGGVQGFLPKPLNPNLLLQVIAELCAETAGSGDDLSASGPSRSRPRA